MEGFTKALLQIGSKQDQMTIEHGVLIGRLLVVTFYQLQGLL